MLTVMCLLSVLAMLMLLTNDQMARSASAGKHPYDTETEDYTYVDQEVRWVKVYPGRQPGNCYVALNFFLGKFRPVFWKMF